MADFKTNRGQDFPRTEPSKLVENDPNIVKVPMDNVDWGSRKGTMARARNPESGGDGKMSIKHVENNK